MDFDNKYVTMVVIDKLDETTIYSEDNVIDLEQNNNNNNEQ